MSKHDLKGIDTKKVGNNKYVNYLFSDYLKDQDLSRKGGIRSLKQAGVNLSDLQPIAPTLKKPETIREKIRVFLGKGPVGTETELIGNKVVGANRPTGLGRLSAGLADFTLFGVTDFDQRGGLFGGKHSTSGYGGGQQLDYKLPKVIRDQLAAADEASKEEKVSKDPLSTENLDKLLDYELKYKKATDAMDRKGRALDAAMEMANIRANMPFITQQMKDLSTFKQAQLLEAERAKQGMPNAIQNRLGQSALTAAAMGNMMANQTDSATRFAQVGMRNPTATFSV